MNMLMPKVTRDDKGSEYELEALKDALTVLANLIAPETKAVWTPGFLKPKQASREVHIATFVALSKSAALRESEILEEEVANRKARLLDCEAEFARAVDLMKRCEGELKATPGDEEIPA